MKDEYGGKSVLIFVGLKSKMYSILDESNIEQITSKGKDHNIFSKMELINQHMDIKAYKND